MSGALRKLLRDLRRGDAEVMSSHKHEARTVVAETAAFYSGHSTAHDETSTHDTHFPNRNETSRGQDLLQRVIFEMDMDKHQQPLDSVSLGQLLDQSRERWTIKTDVYSNLIESLVADRSEDTP